MKRVSLEPAYVLHRRAYRETSLLLEVFSREYGRVSLLAKGVRKANTFVAGLLQPFVPLLISWSGKHELKNLAAVEACSKPFLLAKDCLFAGFYLNELMMALLQKYDPYPGLFSVYEQTLVGLAQEQLDERVLRLFEKHLLRELGYGLLTKNEPHQIIPHTFYRLDAEKGLVTCEYDPLASNIFSGKSLLAMLAEEWLDAESLKDAKRLNRLMLAPLLGSRTIYSRELFNIKQ